MAEPLKNSYTAEFIERLGKTIEANHPTFNTQAFQQAVFAKGWDDLELKARMSRIREAMQQTLNLPYAQAIEALWQPVQAFSNYEAMFFPEFIQAYGLDDWDTSLPALAWFTRFSSSEFAVRPFIEADSKSMMAQMLKWTSDDNYHVRRLASEGCRPRLPWAPALPAFKQDPSPIWPILNALRTDESDYVRRSVANNLNDISKDHPDQVLDWCERQFNQHPHTDWIIKHACRGLLKASHPRALALFGYEPPTGIQINDFSTNVSHIKEGDSLSIQADFSAAQALGKIRSEYLIHYIKANGKSSAKVFILAEGELSDSRKSYCRKQSFARMSTRKHYPGTHKIELRINGVILASCDVELS